MASPHRNEVKVVQRQVAPAADRNKDPILKVLRRLLPKEGLVLEIASGTGQHVVHFAKALPGLNWQPSDPNEAMHDSIRSWTDGEGLANIREPIDLDVHSDDWHLEYADAVVCINMIHIAPSTATKALMKGAGRLLPAGAPLILYGPFRRLDQHTPPSNEAFDRQLRQQNSSWGIRKLEDIERVGSANGFRLVDTVEMPANNLCVVFRSA